MQSATAPAPSRRKGWSPEARARRVRAARATPRGTLPEIIVAERDGREIALTRPDAVVLDLYAACIRRGLDRVMLTGPVVPRLVEFALRRLPEADAPRAEMIAAAWPDHDPPTSSGIANAIQRACGVLRPFGLEITSLWGGTVRLVASERRAA